MSFRPIFVCLLLTISHTSGHAAAPVTARIDGRTLTLHFPPATIQETVTFQLDGRDVPHELSHGRSPAVRWSTGRDLVVNLHQVKRAIGVRWVKAARVWGQTQDGDSLWQLVELPGKDRRPPTSCSCK